MTRRFELEILTEDIGLVDQTSSAIISMTTKIGENGVQISVLETTEKGRAAQWALVLDGYDKAYVPRVVEGNDLVSERMLGGTQRQAGIMAAADPFRSNHVGRRFKYNLLVALGMRQNCQQISHGVCRHPSARSPD